MDALQFVGWLFMAGWCGWSLRTLQIPPAPKVPEIELKIGRHIVEQVNSLHFLQSMTGEGFTFTRCSTLTIKGKPDVRIVLEGAGETLSAGGASD